MEAHARRLVGLEVHGNRHGSPDHLVGDCELVQVEQKRKVLRPKPPASALAAAALTALAAAADDDAEPRSAIVQSGQIDDESMR